MASATSEDGKTYSRNYFYNVFARSANSVLTNGVLRLFVRLVMNNRTKKRGMTETVMPRFYFLLLQR